MSGADRDKWNERYAAGAYAARTHPSVYLEQCVTQDSAGKGRFALDVACGAGRNSLYLATLGYLVDAVDISDEGLARAETSAAQMDVSIKTHQLDLDRVQDKSIDLPRSTYDLIVMFRYVDMPLLERLCAMLAPDGQLIVEEHLQTDKPVVGPRSQRFRVPPGSLKELVRKSGLKVLDEFEGVVEEPDGSSAALARVWGQRVQ